MVYTIYLRTNIINGKQYVGQTKNINQRNIAFKCLKRPYSAKIFDNDRRKYGVDNFDLKILAEVETQEEAWELEKYYIKELNTKYPNGYNVSDGGSGATGVSPSEGTRRKISLARIGEGNGMFGKEPWNKGKHYNGKKKIETIFEYDFDGNLVKKWNSLNDIVNELKIHHSGICQCASGKIPSLKGRIWSYEELDKNDIKKINERRLVGKSHRAKKILQYSDEGELIATYDSITDAAKKLGVCQETIINILKLKNKSKKKNMTFRYA